MFFLPHSSLPLLSIGSLGAGEGVALSLRSRRGRRGIQSLGTSSISLGGFRCGKGPWRSVDSTVSPHTLAPLGERRLIVTLDTDILYLNLFGKDLIILNSTKTISDLLDKRSKIYSDKVSVAALFVCRQVDNGVLKSLAPISHGRPVGPFILRSDAT